MKMISNLEHSTFVYAAIAALTILAALPWVIGARRKNLDVFELVYPFTALYFVDFGGRMIWLLVRPEVLAAQTPHPSVIYAALDRTLLVAALGIAAYLAGYYLPPRRGAPNGTLARRPIDAGILAWAAVVTFAAGFIIRVPFLVQGWFMNFAARSFAQDVSAVQHSLGYLSVLTTIGYALALAAFFSPRRPAWLGWILVIIVPLEGVNAFLTGSKFNMLSFVCIPLILFHYLRRRIPLAALAVVTGTFLFLVVPLITVYRNVVGIQQLEGLRIPAGIPHLVARIAEHLSTLSAREYLDSTIGLATTRFVGIEALASVIGAIPILIAYLGGASLLWAGKILIPTVIWPGKYEVLTQMLQPLPLLFGFADFRRGGMGITLPGELYWNFGTLGVVAGMLLVGMLHRAAVARLRRPGEPATVLLYALIWAWMVVAFDAWFYVTFSNVVRILVLAVAVMWLARVISSAVPIPRRGQVPPVRELP